MCIGIETHKVHGDRTVEIIDYPVVGVRSYGSTIHRIVWPSI